jgi:chemotaxis protein MotB
MADDLKNRPIIIKRKKVVGGDGHHGGAWKVAYADFVTAMMAFFMLMWLLNATTEQQRKGIADYFSPNVPIARISGGGEGAFGGESPFSELSVAQNCTGATNRRPTEGRQSLGARTMAGGVEIAADQVEALRMP